jgi:hypothetical protein
MRGLAHNSGPVFEDFRLTYIGYVTNTADALPHMTKNWQIICCLYPT